MKTWQHAANEWADAATNGLQWLKNIRDGISTPDEAITALKSDIAHAQSEQPGVCLVTTPSEALSQPQQEPWCMKINGCKTKCEDCPDETAQPQKEPVAVVDDAGVIVVCSYKCKPGDKLYTSPPTRKPLMDDSDRLDWLMSMISGVEFRRIGVYCAGNVNREDIARAIEAAHGIKDTP